ncbi:hypothetical protein PanWU01x14_288730 [Parasponia andersonii]|uniref:Uncharacterized protein n=1 Tax=Parasponia andersonii TaxID=3476 RepID=A0A2P5AYA4_PARAD|nr:hypothetical protein PanWU01x14_288730 [Parasponia andersonii]
MSCQPNVIVFNGNQCSCLPTGAFSFRPTLPFATDHGIDYYAISFPETTFEFDSIKKFTKSQAVFLEATLVLLVSWLRFCLFLSLMKPGNDRRSIWFKLRWSVSTLDICFATKHWLAMTSLRAG